METRTYKVYKFKELTEKQKEKVLERYMDINVDHGWWDDIYKDAENIGLKIEGFSCYSACKGELTEEPLTVIKSILKNHGATCETYKTAERYRQTFEELEKAKNTKNGFTYEQEKEYENSEHEFLYDLLKDYRIMLEHEYEYLTSKEAIIETIEANDYWFTEDGWSI